MKKYLGVKIVQAEPMYSIEKEQEGYRVVYEDGYFSWSPKDVFEKAYRPIDGLTFGLAIEALKQGKKVAREGWNSKGMWLKLDNLEKKAESVADTYINIPTVIMKKADNKFVPWLASQTEMLAEDWMIVE